MGKRLLVILQGQTIEFIRFVDMTQTHPQVRLAGIRGDRCEVLLNQRNDGRIPAFEGGRYRKPVR